MEEVGITAGGPKRDVEEKIYGVTMKNCGRTSAVQRLKMRQGWIAFSHTGYTTKRNQRVKLGPGNFGDSEQTKLMKEVQSRV